MNWMQRFMLTRSLALLAIPLALLLWAWAPPARSAVMTISDTDSVVASFDASRDLTLDRFDATLGSLLGVKLEVSLSGNGEAGALTVCSQVLQLPCKTDVTAVITVTLDLFSEGSLALGFDATDSASVQCTVQPGGSQRCSGGPLHPSATKSAEATDQPTLDLFDVPGSFTLHITKAFQSVFAFPTMSASATVTYTYDDGRSASVPEPGTLAAASLALLALAGTARTRRLRRA